MSIKHSNPEVRKGALPRKPGNVNDGGEGTIAGMMHAPQHHDPTTRNTPAECGDFPTERDLDRTSEQSFPASDPPSYSGSTATPTQDDRSRQGNPEQGDVYHCQHCGMEVTVTTRCGSARPPEFMCCGDPLTRECD